MSTPLCLINWLFLFIRLKKRQPRRKIMIKRNAGRNTIIAVQSIKSIHHPDNNRIQKRSLLMGEKGRLVNTGAQTMMCNPVQKIKILLFKFYFRAFNSSFVTMHSWSWYWVFYLIWDSSDSTVCADSKFFFQVCF